MDSIKFELITKKALFYFNRQDYETSYQLCVRALDEIPSQFYIYLSDVLMLTGLIQLHKGYPDEGMLNLTKAEILQPENPQLKALIGYQYAQAGEFDKAYKKLAIAEKIDKTNCNVTGLKNYLLETENNRRPYLFLNTMPKSGTLSIMGALYRGLNAQRLYVTNNVQSFKNEIVDPDRAGKLARGGYVGQAHIAATSLNLSLLDHAGVDRIIVHVRDPRQAMLSWIHYIDQLNAQGSFNVSDYPLCDNYFNLSIKDQTDCKAYFNLSLSKKIDQHIEHYYPMLIEWLNSWAEAQETPKTGLKIKFTSFERFKREPNAFYRDILLFNNIDPNQFDFTDQNIQRKSHFRCGLENEFRTVFTREQLKRLKDKTSEKLFHEFNWEF